MNRSRDAFRLPAVLSFPLAALLAAGALGGIVLPAVYARETPSWTAQGVGQDWVNLVVVAPLLAIAALFVLRGSRTSAMLLGGTLVYAAYSLVLYTFAMHFNVLFLVYTSALGFAFYALVGVILACAAGDARAWFEPGTGTGLAAGYAILLGVLFGALWLSEIVPALAAGSPPKSLEEVGLITNPVHILDLAMVLPAFIAGGWALLRGRPLGYWLVPIVLGFAVLMDLALFGMAASMAARNMASGPPAAVFAALSALTAGILWSFLRHLTSPVARTGGSRD